MEIIESRQVSPEAEWPKYCVHVVSGFGVLQKEKRDGRFHLQITSPPVLKW